jgi:chromosome partitioning protein
MSNESERLWQRGGRVFKAVITNQRGGVGKTITTITLARWLADQGKRVLIVDTDSQGSLGYCLKLKTKAFLFHFVARGYSFEECIVSAHERIDVLCSNRETVQAEASLMGQVGREQAFIHLFGPIESGYDAVLFDVAPSVTLLQTCALVYTGQAVVPVDMDALAFHGAVATHSLAKILNDLVRANVKIAGILPTQVTERRQMTNTIMDSLRAWTDSVSLPLLPSIHNDVAVSKMIKQQMFLQDFAPDCRALKDYEAAFQELMAIAGEPQHAQAEA